MPVYRIKAYDGAGKQVTGTFAAESRQDLLQMIFERSLHPVNIKQISDRSHYTKLFSKSQKKVSSEVLSTFLRQFYSLYHAGISIPECIRVIGMQMSDAAFKRIIPKIEEKIVTGNSLFHTLSEYPEAFPPLLLAMIETGEATGYLEDVLLKMAVFYEKESKVESKVKSATIYPKFLALMSLALIIFMLTFIMPTFVNMFEAAKIPIPTLTQFVMSVSNFVYENFLYIALLCVGIWFTGRIIVQNERIIYIIDALKLKIPVVKQSIQIDMTARMSSALSMLFKSGISMIRALEITQRVLGNSKGQRAVTEIRAKVDQGITLSQALESVEIFPPILISTVRVGEGAGSLDEVLEQISVHFEDERDRNIEKMIKVLEPVMIIVMAVIIGLLVISMVLPMFEMVSSIA